MKAGRPLSELANEVKRQKDLARDYIASTLGMVMDPDGIIREQTGRIPPLVPNEVALEQIGGKNKIPLDFFRRLRNAYPDVAAMMVTEMFHKEPSTRMIRTMMPTTDRPGTMRAFLSDRYRRIDNYDVMGSVLNALQGPDQPNLTYESGEITERRMHVKILFPRIEGEVKVGDPVCAGLAFSNSEVGSGGVNIQPMIFTLRCKNGAIVADMAIRAIHLGRKLELDEASEAMLSDRTRALEDKALMSKITDTVHAITDRSTFDEALAKFKLAAGIEIPTAALNGTKVLARRIGVTEPEADGIMGHLLAGKDLTLWGLSSAVTRYAQDVDDYDRATEMERLGARVIDPEYLRVAV